MDYYMEAWNWLGDTLVVTVFRQGVNPMSIWLRRIDGVFEACRWNIGHISWSTLPFGVSLVDDIILELDMCNVGV